jgi:hypothetical protein
MADLKPYWIIGRRIIAVELNSFPARPDDKNSPLAHQPVIHLDNGARLDFTTEETECGVYGTAINYRKPQGGR